MYALALSGFLFIPRMDCASFTLHYEGTSADSIPLYSPSSAWMCINEVVQYEAKRTC